MEVTRHKTQRDNYITEIFTYVAVVLIYSTPVCVSQNVLCYFAKLSAAHQRHGEVIDRLAVGAETLRRTDFHRQPSVAPGTKLYIDS